MKTFQHMGNPGFPDNNGNVYMYENNVDYNVWKPQTIVKLCRVGWDSDYSNVPGFESDEERDAWFDALEGTSEELTAATELLPDGSIKLPFNFAQASMCNYLSVTFPKVEGATDQRRRWFFFVNDVESLARNTTKLHLQRDEWTCFINDVTVSGMMLERGHYPVAKSSVDTYLANPIANNSLLLAPDVSAQEPRNVASESHVIINDGTMHAVFVTTANAAYDGWGTKRESGWATPAAQTAQTQGVPGYGLFAVAASELATFLTNIDAQLPNFKATVKAVFLVPEKLISLSTSFTFCGVECKKLSASQKSFELLKLSKDKFNYDSKIADLAKLYTSPYAHIDLADENGVFATINIEDCNNVVTLYTSLSLAFPALKIERSFGGINGATQTYTFANISNRTFKGGGDWVKTLGSWDVPTFGIIQNTYNTTDYGTFYNRVQSKLAADNAYTSAEASAANARSTAKSSADTARSNAYDSANTSVANTSRSASAAVSNTATQVAANSAIMERSNDASADDTDKANALNDANQAWDAGYSRACQSASAEAETQTAAVSAAQTAIGTVASVAANPAGAVGTIVNGVASGVATAVNAAISINLEATKTEAGISNSQSKVNAANANSSQRNGIQRTANAFTTNTQNSANTGITANNAAAANSNASASASTAKGNADRTRSTTYSNADSSYSTSVANAQRSKDTSIAAISNAWKQGGLNAPTEFGSFAPGSATTKPMGVFANITTLPKGELARIGAQFKRYGYTLDQYIEPDTLNLMKEFTFWKASDLWCIGANGVPEVSQETIKAAIINGVTVWRNPEKIGTVSIYDN